VRVLDTDIAEDCPFMVMEYVEGVSFAHLLQRASEANRLLPVDVVARILHDTLLGLGAAHGLGAIHRDVSPQNIIVGSDGRARITDFGVAIFAGRLSATAPGHLRGKLGYMSPEQVARTDVDARADVFSAGIVLWEALVGRDLFAAPTQGETLANIVCEMIPPPGCIAPVPEGLDDACMKALERNKTHRWESAEAFASAIAASLPLASADRVADVMFQCAPELLDIQREMRQAADVRWEEPPSSRRISLARPSAGFIQSDEAMPSTRSPRELLRDAESPRQRSSWRRALVLCIVALVSLLIGATVRGLVRGRAIASAASKPVPPATAQALETHDAPSARTEPTAPAPRLEHAPPKGRAKKHGAAGPYMPSDP
jgi:serine/threonine-protein kinase